MIGKVLELIQQQSQQARAERPPNPDAEKAPLIYSAAGKCDRELGFSLIENKLIAVGAPLDKLELVPEPFDMAGTWVTNLGSSIHEELQTAAHLVYPTMEFEVATSIEGIARGRADGWDPTTKTVWELKSMGGFKFKKVSGISGYRRTGGGGPQRSWVIQTGLNAFALGAETIVITAITTEAISKGAAQALGLSEWERIATEWTIPYSTIADEVEAEIENWRTVIGFIGDGVLPPPLYVEDSGEVIELNPYGSRPHWKCQYCAFNAACKESLA